ncbi:MAG: BrnT family toxin [Candidatus Accumulibacter sp.]|nr:BrnT family toxin [Accumulibacter sp.]
MISYDEKKRLANLAKHGFDFIDAGEIFTGFTICHEDERDTYGERRFQSIGLWNGVVVFVVHTARGETDHIISIRKAKKHEECIYWKNYPG